MASEKTPALYVPTNSYEEKNLKEKGNKYCPKYTLSCVLSAILIALIFALCIQFLFPAIDRTHEADNIDNVHVYDGTPIEARIKLHATIKEKQNEQTKDGNPPWHLDFLINPTRLCDSWDAPDTEAYQKNPEVKLLVLIPSATSHFDQRRTIRNTWGSVAEKPHGPMRLGFVLGTTFNSTEEDMIRYESEVYGDIIQADLQDTYRNLTTKSVLMLKWVTKHCPHAQYFLKTDDDTFVNLPILTRILQTPPYSPNEKFIGGYIHRGTQPSRTPTERYYVSIDDYPESEYPPYASGSAYVTTGPTAAQLFEASQRVSPFLPMEDVFITGLCADDIQATLLHEPYFRHDGLPDTSSWDSFSTLATAHSIAPDEMDLVWEQMIKSMLEAVNWSDSSSSSDSSDLTGSISISNLFDWSGNSMFGDLDSEDSSSSSSSESLMWPKAKSIFDIFNLLKNQVVIGNVNGKQLDPYPSNVNTPRLAGNHDGKPLERDGIEKQINENNFLQSQEKQILDPFKWLNSNSSSSSYFWYFK